MPLVGHVIGDPRADTSGSADERTAAQKGREALDRGQLGLAPMRRAMPSGGGVYGGDFGASQTRRGMKWIRS
jgi:hypothetical protein